jgi:fatty-acid desaturase
VGEVRSRPLAVVAYIRPLMQATVPSEEATPGGTPVDQRTAIGPSKRVIHWRHAGFLIVLHVLALLAFVPWFFSWTGVVLGFLGVFVFGVLGINIGYHRLLTHRGFTCPRWLERTLSVLGCCCLQEAPAYWVAIHRRHHHHSDEASDPHSPMHGFLWAHVGWLVIRSDDLDRHRLIDRYARDIKRDPFQAWLVKKDHWIFVALGSWLLLFGGGLSFAALRGASLGEALQLGSSLLIWAAIVRTVVHLHLTWLVNSAAHLWGYRNYQTPDDSRNNPWVAVLSNGEGWHNNHHAHPTSARHGHRWWELDTSWLIIRTLMALGLATNVVLPSPGFEARVVARRGS